MTDWRTRQASPIRTIGLVAPGHALAPDAIARGTERLRALGFESKHFLPDMAAQSGRLAATDAQRAALLVAALDDPSTDAVMAVCGGYGTTRLLPHLPPGLFHRRSKPLIGYSDVTALLLLARAGGAQAIHGPMVKDLAGKISSRSVDALVALLRGDVESYSAMFRLATTDVNLCGTPVAGPLIGGNLSVMAATAGTAWAAPLPLGSLVFFEDWNEPAYSVDRMLVQVQQAGVFDHAAATVVGHLTNVVGESEQLGTSLTSRVGRLAPPGSALVTGLPVGHAEPNLAVLQGARYAVADGRLQPA
ncbi:MAG: LD-carboxypeptidase [Pseudomonadota bacterium]